MRMTLPAAAAFLCVVASAPMAALAGEPPAFPLTPVVFTRQAVPGVDGQQFLDFSSLTISPGGHVSFRANIQPAPGVAPVVPIVGRVSRGGAFQLVAHSTLRPIAGVPSPQQGGYLAVRGNADEYISISSMNTTGGFRYVSAGTPQAPAAIAGIGEPVSGLPGSTHTGSFFNLTQGVGGYTTFVGDFTGTTFGRALWHWSPGSSVLQTALRHNQPISPSNPDLRADLYTSDVFPFVTLEGVFATSVHLSGDGVNSQNDRALVRGAPGSVEILARRGDRTAPGSNMTWVNPGVSSASPAGHLAINSLVVIDGNNDSTGSMWIATPGGTPELKLLAGTPLPPGPGADGDVMRTVGHFQVNSSGAFAGLVGTRSTPPRNLAVVAGTGAEGEVRTIVRQGEQVPGMPEGTVLLNNLPMNNVALSETGMLAFTAQFSSPMLEFASGDGLWAADLLGNLHLVAHSEQLVELAPGDTRVIGNLFLPEQTGPNTVGVGSWSADGTLVFAATFVDGSRAVLTAVVPGPGVTLPFLVLGAWGTRRARRGR